jgi:hypothetical protein
MTEVAAATERTNAMGQTVLTAASDVGLVADTLRVEVDSFLRTMAQGDADNRADERVACNGAPATLRVPDRGDDGVPVAIVDMSRSGAALQCPWTGDVGTVVSLAVQGVPMPLAGRVVRHSAGMLAVVFRQDEKMLAAADAAMAYLTARGAAGREGLARAA